MKLTGKITQVLPIQEGQGKKGPWSKQEFILELPGQYPKKVCLALWGEDKINNYDLQVGLEITAHIEIESREHNGRWYTEVKTWKIEWTAEARKWAAKN